ncbi:MAG: polysaccharide pyruvyl transferase family protein [Lentisphaeria bacterium]|nr:polysaccharide pyruvyl transferase family protein [Lentisphaeria bacterium]
MSKNVVQLVGACRVNKGDRLMVMALQERLGPSFYLPIPVWLNTPAARFWGPVNLGLMLAQAARRAVQTQRHGRPDVLLDCSGYQYGDPWSAMSRTLSIRLLIYQAFRGRGGRIILLPQSMGPFRKRAMASTAAGVLQLADLVFVRDETSRRHALEVGCPPARIHIAPDYSCLVAPRVPDDPAAWARRVCVVPSVRMLDKPNPKARAGYLPFLDSCIVWLRAHGFDPFLLVHQTEDLALARQLQRRLPTDIEILDPSPLEAKGILGCCRAVVASRYHALVGALCQGVPAVGTGWTHKYGALFDDYCCRENLLDDLSTVADVGPVLARVTDEPGRQDLRDRVRAGARRQQSRTREMFELLHATILGTATP